MANANIFAQYAQPFRSVADYRRELDQADASALEMQARRFEFGQARRKVREADEAAQAEARRQNALAALLQESGGDSERFTGLLERSGVPAFFEMAQKRKGEAADVARKAADADKARADARATEAKTRAAEREQSLKDFMRLPDAASVAAFINADASLPMQARQQLAAAVPQDPAQLAQWKLRLYIAATEPEKALPKMETRDAGGSVETLRIDPISGEVQPANTVAKTQTPDNKASNARMAADAAANRAVQIRGQNLADARARASTETAMSRPFEVTGADGKPMLVQQDKAGNIRPVDGFGPKSGSAKPLTDAQAKALLFGSRAREADSLIGGLEGKYSPAAVNAKTAAGRAPLVGGALEAAGNLMLSEQGQKAEQAQRDFVNAVLRRESGAVISEQEFDNAKKQYFPQPGDSAAVKQQKQRNRALAVQGILAEVPEGQRNSLGQEQSSDPVAEALKKYGG